MALSFSHATKRISVPQADAQPLLIQSIVDAIREEEASERGIAYDAICDATGKDVLAAGVTTGITLALRSTWVLEFAAGAYQATITGGNLADALARVYNTGSPQVLINSSAASTAVASDGSTGPSAAEIAAAVLAAMNSNPPGVDVQRMNGAEVIGTGAEADPWRGVGVPPG